MVINKIKGFTLVELLVVVAIIGILSTVIVISVNGAQKKSRDAKRANDIQTIAQAVRLYQTENEQWPEKPTGCIGTYSTPEVDKWTSGACVSDSYIKDIAPTFLSSLPKDPGPKMLDADGKNNRGYLYLVQNNCFKIIAHSPEAARNQAYKQIFDPLRDGPPISCDTAKNDCDEPWAWAYYSPGCETR